MTIDDLDPGDYWYVLLEATRAFGDPLAEPPTRAATERILAAFAAEGVDIEAAIAEVHRVKARTKAEAEAEDGWMERVLRRAVDGTQPRPSLVTPDPGSVTS
jgi:hypothetical protein